MLKSIDNLIKMIIGGMSIFTPLRNYNGFTIIANLTDNLLPPGQRFAHWIPKQFTITHLRAVLFYSPTNCLQ